METGQSVTRKRKSNGQTARAAGAMPPPELNLGELLDALHAMQSGDFSVRLPGSKTGVAGKICDTFNTIVAANERIAQQLEHVGEVVGRQGKTSTRVRFGLSEGAWADMETSVNTLIDDLLWPTTTVTRTVTAVARGDLLQTVPLDVDGRALQGEFLRSANIVNTMIKQLSVFTSEVTRVAREVGTEGKLGGQAQVREVTGVWKDLTESVNSMVGMLFELPLPPPAHPSCSAANPHRTIDASRSLEIRTGLTRDDMEVLTRIWMSRPGQMFAENAGNRLSAGMLLLFLVREVQAKLRMLIGAGDVYWHDLALLLFLKDWIHDLQQQ